MTNPRLKNIILISLGVVISAVFTLSSLQNSVDALATFGNNAVGANADTGGTGYKYGSVYQLSENGSAVSFSLYAKGGTTSQKFIPVIYRIDTAGNPTTLVAQGAEVQINANQAAGWVTSTLPAVSLTSGKYLLGVLGGPNNGGATLYYSNATNGSFWNANAYGSPSSTWGQVNRSNDAYSFYLTYETSNPTPLPVNTTLPAVSGTSQVGQTLTATSGTWSNSPTSYGYQWQRCNASGASCVNISGATASTYISSAGDASSTLRITVNATNAGGSATANSAVTAVITQTPVAPAIVTAPSITGTAQVGQTLTLNRGTWSGNPSPTLSQQWQQCEGGNCTDIANATQTTYVIVATNEGKMLRAVVTATNSLGNVQATTTETAAIVVAPPVTSGVFGGTTPGSQSDAAGAGYKFGSVYTLTTTASVTSFKWYASGGSSNQSFTPLVYNASATGQPTTLVAQGQPVTVNRNQAAGWVTATLPSGVVLQPGKYMLALLSGNGSALNYYDDGASDASYWNYNGSSTTGPSSWGALSTSPQKWSFYVEYQTTTPVAVPTNTAVPVVSGTARVGQQLSATNGTWNGSPTSYTYQWQRCNASGTGCVAISGASSSTYVLAAADEGSRARVVVAATNAGGTATAISPITQIVTNPLSAPANTVAPTISGIASVGQTLTLNRGTWSGNPSPTLSQQWQSCQGSICGDISGATSLTYHITEADQGKTIKAVVRAVNSEGSTETTTTATNAVSALPVELPFTKIVIDNPIGSVIEKSMADINGDGKLDVIIGSQNSPSQSSDGGIDWYQFPASGNPSDPWIKRTILQAGTAYEDMTTTDIDKDGHIDVVASVANAMYWFRNPGTVTGSWQQTLLGATPYNQNTVITADIDGDGKTDVITNNFMYFQNTPTSWTTRQYNSTFNSVALLDKGSSMGSINLVGNDSVAPFNVVWFQNPREVGGNARTGTWTKYYVGPSHYCPNSPLECSTGTTSQAWVSDFNGDGRMDIVFGQGEAVPPPTNGGLKWFEAPADRTQPWILHVIDSTYTNNHNIRTGDVDGNGTIDIVTGEEEQSVNKRITVFYNDGNGNFTQQILSRNGTHNIMLDDVDGDGDLDVLAGNHGWFGAAHPLELYINGRL